MTPASHVAPGALLPALLAAVVSLAGLPLGADELPPLPEAVSSFGAAATGSALYVYGGHVGTTHDHSIENLSTAFWRLRTDRVGEGWQSLGRVRGLQGLALVAHGSRVCRVGGLEARNATAADAEDLRSIAEVACFDEGSSAWSPLPPLPAGRSSHDAVIAGDRLYVIGGWELRGEGQKGVWHDSSLVLDLKAPEPAWRQISQPFERRALAVAVVGERLYAIGGIDAEDTSRRVDVLDLASEAWSRGPDLPKMRRVDGFGAAALGYAGRLVVSGADGAVLALSPEGGWEAVAQPLERPRIFHRVLPLGDELLFVGGAGRGGHYADVERRALGGSALTGPEPAPDATPLARGDWPGFRGRGDSHAGTDLPVRWSEADVAWRVALPGYGQSSPVVWRGQVFVTSAVGPEKETLVLTAVDLETGEVRWRRRFSASQRLPATDTVSRAAPTPVVDATGVFAFWESGDVVATTHQGETLWKRSLTADYGDFAGNHGIGSSPVLTDAAVVVQVTHAGPSYFVALDKGTGANLWKADRDPGVAWSSPALLLTAAGARIVSSAAGRVEALDADTGESLWSLNGVEKNHVPSATLGDGLIVVASSEVGHNFALRPGATPDAPPVVAWRAAGVSSGFGSPLLHGGCALFVNKAGGVTCVDVGSGASLWKHRLADACWASPLASGDLAYFFTKKGVTVVLRTGAEGAEVVAKNAVATDDTVYGVAAVKGAFVVRTGSELARLGR